MRWFQSFMGAAMLSLMALAIGSVSLHRQQLMMIDQLSEVNEKLKMRNIALSQQFSALNQNTKYSIDYKTKRDGINKKSEPVKSHKVFVGTWGLRE